VDWTELVSVKSHEILLVGQKAIDVFFEEIRNIGNRNAAPGE
jgi:hypothetical protein